ncbi:MAG TPA: VWA domain-containing protein [Acidimicrobiales bacterium]|nr:VWA domain-containing protein [Acidimicrobiales bacterium]
MARFQYSRWDGTQVGFDVGADEVFEEINDELLSHGDLNQALQRLLQRGFTDRNGDRVSGMREMLERLRERRRAMLESHDLGGVYEDIAERLREVVDQERQAIDGLAETARASGDQRRAEVAEAAAAERRMALDLLPPDLAGQVRALQDHDWTSPEAQRRFADLMDQLRQQLMQSQFNQMAGAMSDVSPESLQRMKDMFNALNRLLEMREAGQDTEADFSRFMDDFGDFFPGNPETLDELLEQMAQQMAAMSAMLNSMSPEQRAQLQGLSEALLEDMDLRWQVDRLSANLRSAFPQAGWGRQFDFSGSDPLGFADAASVMNQLGEMDQLENLMTTAGSPGALADVDLAQASEMLGPDAARSLEQLASVVKQLRDAGLIDQREGRLELTAKGVRKIGQNALSDLFSKLVKDRMGGHPVERVGAGHERTYETKAYEWGDPFNLSIERTMRNALGRRGAGTPVELSPEDFEVERTETLTRTSTVLMVDLSLSMPMRDNFLAAKKTAMALHALISSQYPRDYLGIVGFGELARELKPEQLPEASWDYTYGTNIQHALMLARRMLARQGGTKQVIMITDGEPTAHILAATGEPFFSYPPAPETVHATLSEVTRCTRDGIRINTFMLDATGYLRDFVEHMTRLNRGRAFFTTPETLGDYVLIDFLDQKHAARVGPGRPRRPPAGPRRRPA